MDSDGAIAANVVDGRATGIRLKCDPNPSRNAESAAVASSRFRHDSDPVTPEAQKHELSHGRSWPFGSSESLGEHGP